LWVKANDHKAKVLVFSSWNDVLDVLEHAFTANNITYIRMKGGRYDNLCTYYFSIYLCFYAGLLDIHLGDKLKIQHRQRNDYDYDPIVVPHIYFLPNTFLAFYLFSFWPHEVIILFNLVKLC